MLTTEENEALCRVGPGTPMGKVLRRYWTPAFQAADLAGPDCPPIRVTAFAMPYAAFIGGVSDGAVIAVPRDDYTCSSIGVFRVPVGAAGNAVSRRALGVDPAVWGPEPGNRRIRLPAQDRAAMAAGQSFAGFRGGNRIQDAAVQMSEGAHRCRLPDHRRRAALAGPGAWQPGRGKPARQAAGDPARRA